MNKEGHGAYVMIIRGTARIGDSLLQQRDALGISETNSFDILAENDAEILVIEVPME